MNSFETILMKLYYLVPTGTNPKLDILEIQYNTMHVESTLCTALLRGDSTRMRVDSTPKRVQNLYF
jgi:hypothetical protein